MSDELKPCPFCGKPAVMQTDGGSYGYTSPFVFIKCCDILKKEDTTDWQSGRGTFSIEKDAKKRLSERWNMRASLSNREAVAVPDLWSFLRDVLRQGAAIESQQGQQGYETFIAHIEAEACRQEKKLRAMISATKPELPAGYTMLSQSMPPEFELWLSKEMPPLTTIGNASWWAPKIWRAALRTGAVPLAASQQAREEGK